MSDPKPMSWPVMLAIIVATAVVSGLILGAAGIAMATTFGTAGVGAATGSVGALLMGRRQQALGRHRPRPRRR